MMDVLSGASATLTFDIASTGLTPTSISYRVVDQDGNVLLSSTATVEPGMSELVLNIPSANNTLLSTELQGARSVEVLVSGDGGPVSPVRLQQLYRVLPADPLVTPRNSFQNLASAEMLAAMQVNIPGWEAASQEDRIAALVDAHRRVCSLKFRWYNELGLLGMDSVSYARGARVFVYSISDMTVAQYNNLNADFREKLRIAQVLEAADLLKNLDDQALREAGVTEVKIGESRRKYRPVPHHQAVVCSRARLALSRYLATNNVSIGRS